MRVFAGYTADRFGRLQGGRGRRLRALGGQRIGFLLVGRSVALIGALVFVDRTGKGIRTAPRDALISLSTPRSSSGRRSACTARSTRPARCSARCWRSAPAWSPHDFDPIFFVSFCFALIGLAVLVLFVENRPDRVEAEPLPPVTMRSVARLLAVPRFGALLVAGGVLALATMSDGFVYLGLQQNLDFAGRNLPLLYVATSLVYMLLAVPAGRLADRIGRGKVFISGYLLLLVVYAALVAPGVGPAASLIVILAFGAYYAATDGVLTALASAMLPGRGARHRPVRPRHGAEPGAARSLDRLRRNLGAHRSRRCGRGLRRGLVVAAALAGIVLTRYAMEPADA